MPLNLCLLSSWQDPHQGLGSKPVLCPLLVISLGHVTKHEVSSLINVMDDLAKVALEVLGGKTLQVGKSCCRDVSLPLQVSFPSINKSSKTSILLHELSKSPHNLQICGRNCTFSTGRKSNCSLLVSFNRFSSSYSLFTHISSKCNDVKIFLDVVHDLGLQESLSSIVHDLIAQLGFCNVFSELLDTGTTSLWGSVQINNLISIVLSSCST